MLPLLQNPVLFILALALLVISISVHEFGHALVADKLGDPTPRALGRLTLNPFAHLDPLGIFFIIFWGFGWGKPVVYDPYNLKNPQRDGAMIALAGPLFSFLFAVIAAILIRIFAVNVVQFVLEYLLSINIMLAIFNLVPIYPLDGFRIVSGLLPDQQREEWEGLKKFGIIVLLILLLPVAGGRSPLLSIIQPVINFLIHLLLPGGII